MNTLWDINKKVVNVPHEHMFMNMNMNTSLYSASSVGCKGDTARARIC